MYLQKLNVHAFRNLEKLTFQAHTRFNLIYGQNGSGKTSLLEAIYFLSLGRSFRSTQLATIIQHQSKGFELYAEFFDQSDHRIASARSKAGKNAMKLDGELQSTQSPLTQAFPVQLFNPESFHLINSGAKQRCKLLDWGAFYHDKSFLKRWQQVKRLIRQRNAALKQRYPKTYIEILDQELAVHAEKLHQQRQRYVAMLVPKVDEVLAELSGTLNITIDYYRGWPEHRDLTSLLSTHFDSDLKNGFTHYGPHRADLRIKAGGHPAHDILSRGQQKLLVAAIKLAQGVLFSQVRDTGCIYLIDDLHSELDQNHLKHLFEQFVATGGQVIATAIDQSHLSPRFTGLDHHTFEIHSGSLRVCHG